LNDNAEAEKMANAVQPPTRLLFLCLARNCAPTIPLFFNFLQRLRAEGLPCTAIIGENGSSDATRILIEQAGPEITLLDTGIMAQAASRLSRMALGRQALLNAALQRGLREEFICVMDLDNVAEVPPSPASVRAAIERLRNDASLFAVGATSSPVYYDLLSLRLNGFDFLANLNADILNAKKKPFSYYRFHCKCIYRNQKLLTNTAPVLCASSFNGFCIYKATDFLCGSYRAPDEAEVCEHVSLNLSIGAATSRRMLIAPELSIQAPSDHIPVGFIRFWFDRIWERLPGLGEKS
jgi:hypothetical protein